MNLTELKQKSVQDLVKIAEEMGADNVGRLRKQDVIFTILKSHSSSGEDISGCGVLEILQILGTQNHLAVFLEHHHPIYPLHLKSDS